MANCGRITAGITNDCDDLLVGGVKAKLYLFNLDDIVGYTLNVTNKQIIEAITLETSPAASGYVFEGYLNSIEPSVNLNKGAYFNQWNHQILFRIFSNIPDTKKQIEALSKGRFVAIIENNYQGDDGNAAFELYGKKVGLEATVIEANKNDADSQGAWVITLATPETTKEPNAPATVFITNYATTKALVEALV